MSKFRNIIEEEREFLYAMYIAEVKDSEKNRLGMYYMVSYQLMERCKGKGDFEIVIEYLKLRKEVEEELEYRMKHTNENSDCVKNTRYKLQELDSIEQILSID